MTIHQIIPGISEYIRDKKNNKIGLIKAYIHEQTLYDDWNGNAKCAKYILITHSKANTTYEDFNVNKAHAICNDRAQYMLRVLIGTEEQRTKKRYMFESVDMDCVYASFSNRCRRYYKDLTTIVTYPQMFFYIIKGNIQENNCNGKHQLPWDKAAPCTDQVDKLVAKYRQGIDNEDYKPVVKADFARSIATHDKSIEILNKLKALHR